MDGQVVLTSVEKSSTSSKESIVLASFTDMSYKAFFQPNQPNVFLTTHGDGCVRLFDLRQTSKRAQSLLRLRQNTRTVSCNSLAWNPVFPFEFVVGGGEVFVRLYDFRYMQTNHENETNTTKMRALQAESSVVRRFVPSNLFEEYQRNPQKYSITGVDFNAKREILATYSRQDVYLFDAYQTNENNKHKVQGKDETNMNDNEKTNITNIGDLVVGHKQVYKGRKNVQTFLKEVCFFGANSYVATGGDDGNLYVWEKQTGKLVQKLRADKHVVNGMKLFVFVLLCLFI
jgi:WD40 repeat protein